MSGFEGGRRPCYLHDLRKVLPDSSDAAMTAGELADANHWYSDAVDNKLGELFSQINRGIVSGIRLGMRGSKDVRYWLEEVTDGGNPIKKAEPKPSPETSPAVKKTRRVYKTTRVQELLGALPRNEAEAVTIEELCDRLKTSEKKVHNYLTKLRRAMERGPYAGVHGEVMSVLENLHGGNPKAGTGPTITIGRYWFKEDGVMEIPEPEPEPVLARALEGETEPGIPVTEIIEALEGGEVRDPTGATVTGQYIPPEISTVAPDGDFSPPFDNIGLPTPEKAVVLKLTEMEATILMDMIGVAMDTIPDLEAWRKVAAKVGGSTGG